MANPFVWTDLSTFDTAAAQAFYTGLFGWRFSQADAGDGTSYLVASHWFTSVAALFEMPAQLQALNLPSFWMSYIRVADVADTVARAKAVAGTVIEVPPSDAGNGAKIALIRDPSGAGFTIYAGPEIDARKEAVGRHMWTMHHSADVSAIRGFYADVFGWRFTGLGGGVYEITDAAGEVIAHAEEAPDDIRGRYRYWMPIYGVRDLRETIQRANELGGTLTAQLPEGRAILSDPQGAGLMVQEI